MSSILLNIYKFVFSCCCLFSTFYLWYMYSKRDLECDSMFLHKTCSSNYRLFIKYCVFSLDFSELCQFCCTAGVLPAWCVYTHWHRGKTEKDQSPECFKILRKNTIFNELPVVVCFGRKAICVCCYPIVIVTCRQIIYSHFFARPALKRSIRKFMNKAF